MGVPPNSQIIQLSGVFPSKNQPAIGVPPWPWKPPCFITGSLATREAPPEESTRHAGAEDGSLSKFRRETVKTRSWYKFAFRKQKVQCVCIYIYICICIHIYIYINICINMYICIRQRHFNIWVRARLRHPGEVAWNPSSIRIFQCMCKQIGLRMLKWPGGPRKTSRRYSKIPVRIFQTIFKNSQK